MSIVFYLTFLNLLFLIYYYFFHFNNINNDNLFAIVLNIIFLSILPIYVCFFKSYLYSLIFSICLVFSAVYLNIRINNTFYSLKILPLIYYFLTCLILGLTLFSR